MLLGYYIGQAHGQDQILKLTISCLEFSLLYVLGVNPYLMKPGSEVYFRE